MRRIILLVFTCFISWAIGAQSLTIHHIGVGQGDGTLILLNDGSGNVASILIDAGNSKRKGDAVLGVVEKYLSSLKHIDFVIVSHLHSDHMGGMNEVFTQLANAGWSVGYIIDRAANPLNVGDADVCYDNFNNTSNDSEPAIPSNQLVTNYNKATTLVKQIKRLNLAAGVDIVSIWLGKNFSSAFKFRSLTANGYVCKKASDYSDWADSSGRAHNENDYSYSFLLEMGSFKYFTGGDIGGERPYVNLEGALTSLFQTRSDASSFHFCAYKATHHGSVHSTNTTFVNYTKPTVTVVPSALRSFSGTQLPGQQTLDRIAASSTNNAMFYTYIWSSGSSASSGTVSAYRDIIITLDGPTYESNHTMTITGYTRDKASLLVDSTSKATTTVQCLKH